MTTERRSFSESHTRLLVPNADQKPEKYEEDNSLISSEYRGITHHSLFNYIYVSDLNPNDKSETCIKLYQFSEPTEKNGDKINIKYRLRKKNDDDTCGKNNCKLC